VSLLVITGLIACNDVSLVDGFSCSQTPLSTFYKQR
jgi:hypothetical protein